MDLDFMLFCHQLSLMRLDKAVTPEERRSHDQFARDYAATIRIVRREPGVARPVRGLISRGKSHAPRAIKA